MYYHNLDKSFSHKSSLQSYMFAYSGEILTKRLRSKAFRAILRQDMTYFDQGTHSTGALCTRLATEASAVQGASGVRFGFLCQTLVSLGMGLIIGFIFSWQLTLMMMAFIPFVILGAYFQMRVTASFEDKDKQFVDDAGKVRD
jgi:ATP-binding cassette subfamily B (MDR/TAP) protein 1